ncbi:MAG TPA: hypothetical protein VMT85_14445, partial [Thermoanaerobaculia bacterium]|nr:hypothetical protein [Thermoanaerobaculia bacterium]
EYSLRLQQLDEDLGPVRGSTWEPSAWMRNLRDLTLFCFPDAANPDPESRSACTTESPVFGAFAFDEGPDTPRSSGTAFLGGRGVDASLDRSSGPTPPVWGRR